MAHNVSNGLIAWIFFCQHKYSNVMHVSICWIVNHELPKNHAFLVMCLMNINTLLD